MPSSSFQPTNRIFLCCLCIFSSTTAFANSTPDLILHEGNINRFAVEATDFNSDNTASSIKVVASKTVAAATFFSIANNEIGRNQTICAGQLPAPLVGSVPTGGNGTYSYQWEYSRTGNSTGFSLIQGANGINYTPGALASITWFRRKVISGNEAQSFSNVVSITVEMVLATPSADGVTVCAGARATLEVKNPSSYLKYRWYQVGQEQAPYADGTSIVTIAVVQDTMYYVEAVNGLGCLSPRTAVPVTIAPPSYTNVMGEPQEICSGETPQELKANATEEGTVNQTYLWEVSTDNVNFAAAPGENTRAAYQPAPLLQTSWFRRKVMMQACGPDTSEPVKITAYPLPAKPTRHQEATVLTADVATVGYEWLKDGQPVANAATKSVTVAEAGLYQVRALNEQGCFSDYSDAVEFILQPTGLLKDAAKAGIKIVPNPTAGKIFLHTKHP